MTITAYLELSGIEGSSTDLGYEDMIPVHDVDWSLQQQASAGGRRRTSTEIEPLGVTKWVDKSSPYLTKACASGSSIGTATLHVMSRSRGGNMYERMTLSLTNCRIQAVAIGTPGHLDDETWLEEELLIEFAKMTYTILESGTDSAEIS